jgi:hypothetical protein
MSEGPTNSAKQNLPKLTYCVKTDCFRFQAKAALSLVDP